MSRRLRPARKAESLLLQLKLDVYVWRVSWLDSEVFRMLHGEPVSVEPLFVAGMARRVRRASAAVAA